MSLPNCVLSAERYRTLEPWGAKPRRTLEPWGGKAPQKTARYGMYARGEHSTAPTQNKNKTPKNSLRAKNKKGTIYHEVCAESSFIIPVATLDLDSLPDSIKNSFFKISGGGVSTA